MEEKYLIEIIVNKEKLSDGSAIFVAHCPTLGIASQGSNVEEAIENAKEAINLYLEEQPEVCEEILTDEMPVFSIIEVKKNAKTSCIVG